MAHTSLAVIYLISGVLFILSLGGLSHQETARRGNLYGMLGMVIALGGTLFHSQVDSYGLLSVGIVVGAVVGAVLAVRVVMTAMPQLVAILHSFVGLAAVLVGVASYLDPHIAGVGAEGPTRGAVLVHALEIWIGVAVGAVTFTGSVIAWAKLRGSLSGKPLLLPGRHVLNLLMLLCIIGLAIPFVDIDTSESTGRMYLLVMAGVAGILGVHLVMAIGGADMPVVVSLLNSYSGWAAAAAGFMLSNDLLIITGALVGSSGAILSYIMCRAMNRSILNVVFGGFGTGDAKEPSVGAATPQGEVQETTAENVAALLASAQSIIIVPGYGLAVARAQHLINELALGLRKRSADVRYAIHPVAGRLPGHMNVLLAEAGVPYDIVLEMDEINADFPATEVVLVVGANDIVNPDAESDEASPIYGMPVLQAWKAKQVVVLKRSMGSGYAGVQNPLFFHDNTQMLFGDAKDSIQKLVSELTAS